MSCQDVLGRGPFHAVDGRVRVDSPRVERLRLPVAPDLGDVLLLGRRLGTVRGSPCAWWARRRAGPMPFCWAASGAIATVPSLGLIGGCHARGSHPRRDSADDDSSSGRSDDRRPEPARSRGSRSRDGRSGRDSPGSGRSRWSRRECISGPRPRSFTGGIRNRPSSGSALGPVQAGSALVAPGAGIGCKAGSMDAGTTGCTRGTCGSLSGTESNPAW